ncbi:hypothetical protein PmNV_111 [Penaeus monodon nudivirus]|uniref:Uncharacterized protein n=1 Tax=Penaeus monodon nudivirus TaxID=1529056 RepID=A0A076FET8_9VIRU|nr:hypothetical protein PmNV_111 [Penaeus monodon nudivirus]AII15899.1 hypothetical protein PmNV_111 [Penaeus monodon nudivirus]
MKYLSCLVLLAFIGSAVGQSDSPPPIAKQCDTIRDTVDGADERLDLCAAELFSTVNTTSHAVWSMGSNYNEFERFCTVVDDVLNCTMRKHDVSIWI